MSGALGFILQFAQNSAKVARYGRQMMTEPRVYMAFANGTVLVYEPWRAGVSHWRVLMHTHNPDSISRALLEDAVGADGGWWERMLLQQRLPLYLDNWAITAEQIRTLVGLPIPKGPTVRGAAQK